MAKFEINLDGELSHEREIGKAGMIAIDLAKMPAESLAYIFGYGLKQVLADAHSAAKDAETAKQLSLKKLDALYEGKIRASSGRTSDPVLAEAKRLAKAAIEAALKAKKQTAEAKAITEAVAKLAPNYMEKARENIEAAKELSSGIDLANLF
jgi:hypothetical protein